MRISSYKLFLYISFIPIFISFQHNEEKKLEELLEFYLNGLITFESDLIKHFPFEFGQGEIQKMVFESPESIKKGGYAFALVSTKPIERKYQMIADSIKYEYNPVNMIMNEALIMLPDSNDFFSIADSVIIPKFYKILGDSIPFSDLINDYQVYIIDSDTGNYSGANDIIEENHNFPLNFKHGYSRGYCINETDRNIIHWLIVW